MARITQFGGALLASTINILNQAIAGGLGPGQTFYVDATNGVAGNDGLSGTNLGGSQGPVKTITQALALCVSDRGDTIFVLPGSYTENVTISKNGVTLAGAILGGYERPDIVPAAGVALTVTGQGVSVLHVRCASTAADCMQQRGNGFLIEDCVFDVDNIIAKCGLRLLPSDTDDSKTASEGKVLNNLFRYAGNNPVGIIFDTGAAPAVGVGSTDNVISGNRFYGGTGIDIATADAGGGVYSVHTTLISENQFMDKNKATYIDLSTTNGGAASDQTGAINENVFAIDKGGPTAPTTTQIKMVGTGFTFSGNYGTIGVLDGSGLD